MFVRIYIPTCIYTYTIISFLFSTILIFLSRYLFTLDIY